MLSLRTATIAACFASLATFASPSAAGEPPVRIRELTLNHVHLDAGTVRAALGEELANIATRSGSKCVALRIVVARHTATNGNVEYSVSAVVEDARAGNVLGMLEGHARAAGGTPSDAFERSMLQGAAHGALGSLPGLLR